MMARFPRAGRVAWIGVRPARRAAVVSMGAAEIREDGLAGDHAPEGPRAVTLIQAEHLPVIAALAGLGSVTPGRLRRNLVVEGINLAALRRRRLAVGGAVLEVTGPCPPCSRMEEELGEGGYNAVRGHGGWYARVVEPGAIALGAEVRPDEALRGTGGASEGFPRHARPRALTKRSEAPRARGSRAAV